MKLGKLVPTKLGKIVARYNLDPFLANNLIQSLKISNNLAIDNLELFLYELRLYLIANDNDELLKRDTDYEVTADEFKLLKFYQKGEEFPSLEVLRDTLYKRRYSELHEYEKQIKQLLLQKKIS